MPDVELKVSKGELSRILGHEFHARGAGTPPAGRPGVRSTHGMGKAGSSEMALVQNSASYVMSIKQPFVHQGARVPDMSRVLSTVSTCSGEVYPMVTAFSTGTGSGGGFCMYPQMTSMFQTIAAGTSLEFGGRANFTPPWVTGVSNNAELYRTVSMGVVLENTAELLARGGRIYVNASLTKAALQPLSKVELAQHPATEVYDAARVARLKTVWFPLTLQSGIETVSTGNVEPTATSWKQPASTDVSDCGIIVWFETGDAAVKTDLVARYVFNYEFIPLTAVAQLFDLKSVLGDPHSTAVAWTAGTNDKQSVGQTVAEQVRDGARGIGSELWTGLKSGYQQMARSLNLPRNWAEAGQNFAMNGIKAMLGAKIMSQEDYVQHVCSTMLGRTDYKHLRDGGPVSRERFLKFISVPQVGDTSQWVTMRSVGSTQS